MLPTAQTRRFVSKYPTRMAVPDDETPLVPVEILLIVAINVVAGVLCYCTIQLWDIF
jgi:hypothetical protein